MHAKGLYMEKKHIKTTKITFIHQQQNLLPGYKKLVHSYLYVHHNRGTKVIKEKEKRRESSSHEKALGRQPKLYIVLYQASEAHCVNGRGVNEVNEL